jgi:hypothetical protein
MVKGMRNGEIVPTVPSVFYNRLNKAGDLIRGPRVESVGTRKAAEVKVERPILLEEDKYMLDVQSHQSQLFLVRKNRALGRIEGIAPHLRTRFLSQ